MVDLNERRDLRALAIAAVERIAASGRDLDQFRGIAVYDTAKDEIFTSLDAFPLAESAIAELALVIERYGVDEAERLTLQFVYQLLDRLAEPTFDDRVFEQLWTDFIDELREPQWVYRGAANLRWFTAEDGPFDFGSGVSIRGRSYEELADLGFSESVLRALSHDWSGFGASSYVIVVESRVDKSPDNLVLGSLGTEWVNAQRVLGALRLLAAGDVSIGRMWISRPARFNVGLGGVGSVGLSIPTMGATYHLTTSVASRVSKMYGDLQRLEEHGYGGAPGNLDLALRSFMATYDRWPSGGDSRVLDAITALEAVLGSGVEIAFKLSFRTAGILAANDAQRVAIFDEMKEYYDLRSKLVHGASLKDKHRTLIADPEGLRHFVRELLRGFIHLAVDPQPSYGKQFFKQRLDAALQDESERAELRNALNLGTRPKRDEAKQGH
jgi:hypothetical protein